MAGGIGAIARSLGYQAARIRGQAALAGSGVEGDFVALGAPIVSMVANSRIVVGKGSLLISSPRWTALAIAHPVVLRTMRAGAVIEIGREVGISGASICAALRVSIGHRTLVGADAMIVDTDFHALERRGAGGGGDPDPLSRRTVEYRRRTCSSGRG